jgi:predicted house-cleaning noncanonical NTP pyrophosphatase (MazG superfamily)
MLKGKIIFEKLVRDGMVQKLERDSFSVNYHIITNDERKTTLQTKLIEEINELLKAQSRKEILEELCDIYDILEATFDKYNIENSLNTEVTPTIEQLHLNLLEIINSIESKGEMSYSIFTILSHFSRIFDINNYDLYQFRKNKNEQIGGFKNGVFIKYIEFDQNSNLTSIEYFKNQQEKYQIIQ